MRFDPFVRSYECELNWSTSLGRRLSFLKVLHYVPVSHLYQDMRAETHSEAITANRVLPQVVEELLNLVTPVSMAPGARHLLETCNWEAVVAVTVQEAPHGCPITKLNSWLELSIGLVDKVLDLHIFDRLGPGQELFRR